MARQEIDLTTPQPNGKMGEPTKSAWEKVNDMTLELYDSIDGSYNPENIIGTVSQDSGIPTGAIIQSGSGSNGRYVKYADGTQICFGQVSFVIQNGVHNFTLVYPLAFAFATCATIQFVGGNSLQRKSGVEIFDATQVVGFYENLSATFNGQLHFIAIGRWY